MLKRLSIIMMAFVIAFSFSATGAGVADAKGYKSSKKSFNPSSNTTQTPNSGVNKADPAAATKTPGATNPTTATKPGFFSGGLMKGLLIGGIAGMLFGGLFGNLGMLGNILGFLINMMAIFAVVVLVIRLVHYFREKRKFKEEPKRF
ncbi:hypothetical protein ACFQ88_01210 [Paenibacillus sp. NPDC056579]|uniref:hypothetical protein n=1 Tax=unclassified Paenibacillus TaxID=185978 RepID=UPI001EF93A16|nr:hypothetical protein [Paenibacillus sp. H1-7]ULL15679.1 preprotein translocase subunit Tim44 [Paenibacillus sp. H1-7]